MLVVGIIFFILLFLGLVLVGAILIVEQSNYKKTLSKSIQPKAVAEVIDDNKIYNLSEQIIEIQDENNVVFNESIEFTNERKYFAHAEAEEEFSKIEVGKKEGYSVGIAPINISEEDKLSMLKCCENFLLVVDLLKKMDNVKDAKQQEIKLNKLKSILKTGIKEDCLLTYKHITDILYPNLYVKLNELRDKEDEDFTEFELRLAALCLHDMSAKEIAELSGKSVRTVETGMYKLRKKLSMHKEEKIQHFLKNIL